jgi:hypothetical protein
VYAGCGSPPATPRAGRASKRPDGSRSHLVPCSFSPNARATPTASVSAASRPERQCGRGRRTRLLRLDKAEAWRGRRAVPATFQGRSKLEAGRDFRFDLAVTPDCHDRISRWPAGSHSRVIEPRRARAPNRCTRGQEALPGPSPEISGWRSLGSLVERPGLPDRGTKSRCRDASQFVPDEAYGLERPLLPLFCGCRRRGRRRASRSERLSRWLARAAGGCLLRTSDRPMPRSSSL